MQLRERGDVLVVSARFSDIFDRRLARRLDSGFETTVVVLAEVIRDRDDTVVAVSHAVYTVIYDLWDEEYVVHLEAPRRPRTLRTSARAEALAEITRVARLPVAPLSRIPRGPHHHVRLTVQVNPMSEEALAEVRGWLARGAGGDDGAANPSMFGLIVSLFVNPKIDAAEATLRFRSQPFYRPYEPRRPRAPGRSP